MKQTVYVNFETREVYGEEELLDTIDSWLHDNYDMIDLFYLLPEHIRDEMRRAFTEDYAKDFKKFEIE